MTRESPSLFPPMKRYPPQVSAEECRPHEWLAWRAGSGWKHPTGCKVSKVESNQHIFGLWRAIDADGLSLSGAHENEFSAMAHALRGANWSDEYAYGQACLDAGIGSRSGEYRAKVERFGALAREGRA